MWDAGRDDDAMRLPSPLPPLSRRELLALGLTSAAALLTRGLGAQAADGAPPAMRLLVRNARPFDGETPLAALASFRTPPELFFVRSHFGPPTAMPASWTLTIDGEVRTPTTLSLADIRGMSGVVTRPVTLECAGNGRAVYGLPKTSGVQWERGAVSTAEWTGVPLATVLERAGLQPSAQHLWMEALDRATDARTPRFLRSIPRDVALGDAFVAFAMNGAPIPLLHGGPLRLIVPGWHGMASTKWLTHVHARPTESDNHFMARSYRYPDGTPVTTTKVKSVIAAPLAGARVAAGRVRMRGQAWSGSADVRGVDVSGDGGRTWRAARLTGTEQRGAWRGWEADVDLRAGRASLMARATDATGAVQPMAVAPNPGGFGNNSIHEVTVDVA